MTTEPITAVLPEDLPPTEAAEQILASLATTTDVEVARIEDLEPVTVSLPDPSRWQQMGAMAVQLAESGLLRPALQGKPADVLTVLLVGHDLGLPASTALTKIHVIEGMPSLAAEVQVGLVRGRGHRIVPAEGTDGGIVRNEHGHPTEARVTGTRSDNGDTVTASYTTAEALAGGLIGKIRDDGSVEARSKFGKPKPWETATADLLWARACTRLTRRLFSDVLGGVTYTAEELGEVEWSHEPAPNPEQAWLADVIPEDDSLRTQITARIRALPEDDRERFRAEWHRRSKAMQLRPWKSLTFSEVPELLALIASFEPEFAEIVTETGPTAPHVDETGAPDAGVPNDDPAAPCADCGLPNGSPSSGCMTGSHPF